MEVRQTERQQRPVFNAMSDSPRRLRGEMHASERVLARPIAAQLSPLGWRHWRANKNAAVAGKVFMTGIHRRKLLAGAGGSAVAVKLGGMAGILAAARAPALAQGTTLHWPRVDDFVPASDAFLRKELLPEAERAFGLKVNLETINGNDVQARITAGIQTSAGPDMINVFNNWAQLYAESVADVSDVAEEIGNAQGGFYDLSTTQARGATGWLAVPKTPAVASIVNYKRVRSVQQTSNALGTRSALPAPVNRSRTD